MSHEESRNQMSATTQDTAAMTAKAVLPLLQYRQPLDGSFTLPTTMAIRNELVRSGYITRYEADRNGIWSYKLTEKGALLIGY